ncbi:MAG TPA: hypothetical protein PKX00_10530, partial [Opitutaceae bacterium]|nr:hypothetical protein [Opitutaceae bacterium]
DAGGRRLRGRGPGLGYNLGGIFQPRRIASSRSPRFLRGELRPDPTADPEPVGVSPGVTFPHA